MNRLILAALSITAALVQPLACLAAVDQVAITERAPFAPGVRFGDVGAYEKIRGIAYFSLDPGSSANARLVDLKHAPRDSHGRVTFQSEFVLLRPIKAHDSTLLYDVNNRGSIAILGQINGQSPANNDPSTAADAGDGFLMRHGFTLLFSAWTWDVAPAGPGARPLVLSPPIAKADDGSTITGTVANEFSVESPTRTATYAGIRGLTYEPATANDPAAILSARARPDDVRQPIAREQWHFMPPEHPGGPGRIEMDAGFRPGTLYEIQYAAQNPYVGSVGLAGIRDLLAWFRDHPFAGMAPPHRTMIFGISQSARVIGRMLYDGLDVDETGKLAFSGAFMQVPGAGGSAGFNSRFVQPTRHPSMLEEHDYPSDVFPFTTAPTRDPVSGIVASRLDRARDSSGHTPKLIVANTSAEYWNREASLVTTTPDGASDVPPARDVRVYVFMGAQHYVGRSKTRAPYTSCPSTTDHYLPVRALILALDSWMKKGTPPPESSYPQIGDATLVTVASYRDAFPSGIGIAPPDQNLAEPRLDFGALFGSEGIALNVPPGHGARYESRVPAPDPDGNDRGGVRLVELQVPLGTHTGWNLRAPETGFPWATARFDGSFVPFARTEAERLAAGDPRPSLAARYPTRDDYVAKVRAAALRQITAGFLLEEDRERAIEENVGLYDRILSRNLNDSSCTYLYPN